MPSNNNLKSVTFLPKINVNIVDGSSRIKSEKKHCKKKHCKKKKHSSREPKNDEVLPANDDYEIIIRRKGVETLSEVKVPQQLLQKCNSATTSDIKPHLHSKFVPDCCKQKKKKKIKKYREVYLMETWDEKTSKYIVQMRSYKPYKSCSPPIEASSLNSNPEIEIEDIKGETDVTIVTPSTTDSDKVVALGTPHDSSAPISEAHLDSLWSYSPIALSMPNTSFSFSEMPINKTVNSVVSTDKVWNTVDSTTGFEPYTKSASNLEPLNDSGFFEPFTNAHTFESFANSFEPFTNNNAPTFEPYTSNAFTFESYNNAFEPLTNNLTSLQPCTNIVDSLEPLATSHDVNEPCENNMGIIDTFTCGTEFGDRVSPLGSPNFINFSDW